MAVSDEEREEVAEALRARWFAGHLQLADLDERTTAAYAAQARADLDALLADLPPVAPRRATPAPVAAEGPFWPGTRAFHHETVLREPRLIAFDQAVRHIGPTVERQGYVLLVADRPRLLRFERQRGARPISIAFLPAAHGATRLIAFGKAPARLRKAFAKIHD